MCGICGFVSFRPDPIENSGSLTHQMMHLLEHRGPDDSGFWNDRNAILGHRRLSIIDLSHSGHQPKISDDGTKVLVFNGEIYNFAELKKQFGRDISFRYHNDSEVILKLYEKFHSGCLQYLRGMFAFAIWDAEQQELFFARDRVGKKPFIYSVQNDSLIFASELRALLLSPDFRFEIDEAAIFHYLTLQYIPSPQTIYKNVFKLPPAHYGIYKKGKLFIDRYWQLRHRATKCSEEEALEQLDVLLKEAVRLRMISDVPLGALLSGGIDSSTIVALMSELSPQRVKTFHIHFEEEDYSEAVFAREIAKRFETEHHELVVRPDFVEVLPKLILHYSEPFADSSAIPYYYLSRMTRDSVTVALGGDGGDELFGGYPRYQFSHYGLSGAGASLLAYAARPIPLNMRYMWRVRKFIDELTLDIPSIYLKKICFFDEEEKSALLTPEFYEKTKNYSTLEWLRNRLSSFPDVPFPEILMALDIQTYLPDDLLVKADIASMACSLEARCPFLDHRVMEFAASLPADLKIRAGVSKYLLKRYLHGKVPSSIVQRSKMGFGIPLRIWFRKDLQDFVQDILLSPTSLGRGYFTRSGIQKILRNHASGMFDNSYKIYALLVLELWHRTFVDGSFRVGLNLQRL